MTDTPHFKALQLFVAAFGALSLAMALGLSHPFWAAMPVWVVVQPYRQDLLIRGVLRVLGTLVGAALGLGVLLTSDSVAFHVIALGLLVGGFTALSFWIGTVYSYGATLAAMTVAVVLLPAVAFQSDPVVLAVDRVWCTLIGVIAVTLATVAFTGPRGTRMPLRIDHGRQKTLPRGMIAGLGAMGAMLLAEIFGGPVAVSAGLAICIYAILVGTIPDPRPLVKYLLPGVTIGLATGLAYRALLSATGTDMTVMLALTAAFFGALAWLRCNPRTAALGMDSFMIFLLTAEVGSPGHSLAQQGLGGLALLASASAMVLLYRPMLKRQTI
ncbi:FUSC family protein [Pseudooceanicola sp. HF7]|uniref:FUSC family protein n=1 Tax=Pseudooceanicola sp. HF7 TaxID=2721560 RepID=UPI0014306903|nr:FUSC family protein [Pseudooceanicola sp. HF7]NIZ09438.1 hypothetical protein [Pseudooceanicola sp. HF7]